MAEQNNELKSQNPTNWLDSFKTFTGNFSGMVLPRFTFLKVIVSVFLLILLFIPSWIKTSLKESELLLNLENTVKIVSNNFKTLKYGGFEIESHFVNKVSEAKVLSSNIDPDKITDETTKKEVEKLVSLVKETDNTLKSELIKQETPSVGNSSGWIYLGKTNDKSNILNPTTNITNINQISTDKTFQLADATYLREETGCPRSAGKIITAIEKGKQIKASSSPEFCEINGQNTDKKEYGVWLKVERQ